MLNIDRESLHNEAQQQNIRENRAHIDACNEDFLYPLFDVAELEEILQLAKAPRTAELVKNHIFPVKYQNYEFNFQLMPNPTVITYSDFIYIQDFDFFMDLITYFGKKIKRLGVNDSENINDVDSAALFENIIEHCSSGLTTITLGRMKNSTFAQFTKPFPNVKRFDFFIRIDEVGSILPFNDIFPNLEHLRLIYYDSTTYGENNETRFINIALPAMEHLRRLDVYIDIIYNPADIATVQKQLGSMLQKNPQIRTLNYKSALNDFILQVNEYLPNLDSLTILSLDPQIQPVHFKNVKYFKVITCYGTCPVDRISFSNLNTLEMTYSTVDMNVSGRESWRKFFRNHQTLRQLNCQAITEAGLVEFLPRVHEIQIYSSETFHINFVIQLIESNNFSKIFYRTRFGENPDMHDFYEKFEGKWRINHSFSGRPFIELERKN